MSKTIEARLGDGRSFSLAPSDWAGEGGEGAVYRKGSLAIKIVQDKAALARKEPKLRALMALAGPGLATPVDLAYDQGGALMGYAMPWVEGTSLARLMSPHWRAQNGWPDDALEGLGKAMAKTIESLHARSAWGGDLNEFNWMVGPGGPVLIDCDSWGCAGHPVSAMMPSVADPLARGSYGPPSDWYALAVLLFSLYAGIHPFRGRLDGFGPKEMDRRMREGASLFRSGARWPGSVPGVAGLPPGLAPWLKRTLESNLREAPPKGAWSSAPPVAGSARLVGEASLPAPFARWMSPGLALLADGSAFEARSGKRLSAPSAQALRWLDPIDGAPWWIWLDGQKMRGQAMGSPASFEQMLPSGSSLRLWDGEFFAIGPGRWSQWAPRKVGSMGVRAMALGQGLLAGRLEDFDGCVATQALGSLGLAKAAGRGKGARWIALPKAPGERLVGASCHGGVEWTAWALPDGSRETRLFSGGKLLGSWPGQLEWACAAGSDASIAQIDGEAFLARGLGAQIVQGWVGSLAPASCWEGTLWRVEVGSLAMKGYSLAKLLG